MCLFIKPRRNEVVSGEVASECIIGHILGPLCITHELRSDYRIMIGNLTGRHH